MNGPLPLSLVAMLELAGPILVVAVEHGERSVGDVGAEEPRRRAEQGVTDFEVGVEERERLAVLQCLQPQGDLRDLDGKVIDVDAIDAASDDVAECVADVVRRRLGVAGANAGEGLCDAAGGGDEEMAGSAGGIADGERREEPPPGRVRGALGR